MAQRHVFALALARAGKVKAEQRDVVGQRGAHGLVGARSAAAVAVQIHDARQALLGAHHGLVPGEQGGRSKREG